MKKLLLLSLVVLPVLSSPLRAQNEPADPADPKKTGESPGPNRFWQANVNGGSYMVALDRIVSVSRQKYLLDGAVIVDEVTIDTVGQALARFYLLSPLSDAAPGNTAAHLAERGRELLDTAAGRTGVDVQNMVVKKYPETTHAKELEYRILTEAQLNALHSSAKNAWESGRGRQFTAK